ncbi:MAG: GumC family protein [bacterium]
MDILQDQGISLNDIMRTLYRGRKIIAATFFSVVLLTGIYTFTADPVYEASAKLIIKDESGMQDAILGISNLGFSQKDIMINNQVEILKSRTLAENVINKLMKSEQADQLEILGVNQDGDENSRGILASFSRLLETFGKILSGDSNQQKTQEELFDETVEELQDRIHVVPIRDTDMIDIRVTAYTPNEASFIANTLTKSFLDKSQLESQEEVRQVKNFLAEQLSIVKNKLVESEEKLKKYKEKEKVVALPEETQELVQKLAEFEGLYNEALTEFNSAKKRLTYIDEQLAQNRQNFDIETISMSPYLEELKKKMAEIEGARAVFVASLVNKGVYDANSPQIKQYDDQISELKDRFKTEVTKMASVDILDPVKLSESLVTRKIEIEADIESLKPKVSSLKKIVDDYNAQLETLPDVSLKLARLERSAKVDEKIYLMMQEKFEESRITEVGQLGNARIIDPAKAPKDPIKPRKKLNMVLAVFMGLGLGIGITFVLDFMDNSVHSMEELERQGIPVLGSIPVIRDMDNKLKKKRNGTVDPETAKISRLESRMISHFAPKSPISEAYRTFRTNVQYSKADKPLKSILLTSPGPGEGKSTSIANLAITLAQQGSRVLLVDSDLRRPILHNIFKVDKSNGLSNRLVGRISTSEAIRKTYVENLYLMPCGTLPPNPSELLGSVAMKDLIGELNSRFDVILLDSPPVIAVTDPAVLSAMVDGVVIIVMAGQTHREAAQRAFTLLKNVNSHVLGALLNGVQVENIYGSYYYYYHYHYYGKDGEKSRKHRV